MFNFRKKILDSNWKEKAKERSQKIKQLKKMLKESSKNKDKWKKEAEKYKNLLIDEVKKKP